MNVHASVTAIAFSGECVMFLLVSGAPYRVMCVVHEEGRITRAGNVNGTYGLDGVESILQ